MRVKTRRRGRKLYYGVVHDYRNPGIGRRCQLSILPLGKHATVAEALKATDERIGWLQRLWGRRRGRHHPSSPQSNDGVPHVAAE
jgi:hypothetical protein